MKGFCMKLQLSGWAALLLAAPAVFSAHTVSLPASLADAGTQVVDVHIGLAYSEGPAVDPAGNLFFSENPDVDTGQIWKMTPDGTKSVYKNPSRGSNGLEFDNQGRLNIAMNDSLLRVETNGQVTVLHASQPMADIGRVNDLSISSMGSMFFTNLNGNTLFFRSTAGQITTRNFSGVNGGEWIEEKNIVYVASGGLQKCRVDNATGVLTNCASFAGATDGLTTDIQGNVWRANWGEGKVYVHDSTGTQLGVITIDAAPVPGKRYTNGAGGNASNCHHGGPDLKTLYITGDGGLYKLQVKVAGRRRPSWPTAARPAAFAPAKVERHRFLRTGGALHLETDRGRVKFDGRRVPANP